jgi:hypothetical protein
MSARMRSRGDTRVDTGVGSFLCLRGFERNLRPSSIYTGDRTPPLPGVGPVGPALLMILIITVKAPATKGVGPQIPLGSALTMPSSM